MTRHRPQKIVVVTGPTASGKSQLALDLASLDQDIIINADSVQLYHDLPILSASPTEDDFKKVSHHLYGILNPYEQWNSAFWCDQVLDLLNTINLKNQIPFLVGGTGLYLKGLMEGLSPIPPIHPDYRKAAFEELQKRGHHQFFQELAVFDPKIVQHINSQDTQRLIRAWEVYHGSGKSLSYWQEQPKNCKTKHCHFIIFHLNPPRPLLIEQADRRLDQMITQGALEEVQHLIDRNVPQEAPINKTLGARPLLDYFKGHHSLEQAITLAKKSTHQYIKRQQTWFRHQLNSCHKIDDFYSKDALRYAQSVLKEFNN